MIEFDEWGPEKVVKVYDPHTRVWGVTVIDNTALGPGKGGIRMVADVTTDEVARLARAMTWKNALAELPLGGAKSGIRFDARKDDKAIAMRAFSKCIKPLVPKYYVAAPDMNVSEKEMAVMAEVLGPEACTGKPAAMGGLPHELGSTGYGVAQATFVALDFKNIPYNEATVAIEGFGNVGTFTAKFLAEKGVKVVAVSDSRGCVHEPEGIDVEPMISCKNGGNKVCACGKHGVCLPPEKLFGLDVDVLIPGARPDAINASNMKDIQARIIVEAANIPIPLDVECELEQRLLVVPDVIANAGGVISSFVEMQRGSPEQMFERVRTTICKNTKLVLNKALELGDETHLKTREAATLIAQERVRKAMEKNG